MKTQTQNFSNAVLALPEAERAWLVERLLESLSPEPDELTDDEWLAELERRSADFKRSTADAVPWSE